MLLYILITAKYIKRVSSNNKTEQKDLPNMIMTLLYLIAGIASLWVLVGLAGLLQRVIRKPIPANTRYFRDSDGRIVIYHGVNVSNYSKNSFPDNLPWHQPEDYDKLKKWGFNLVRFTVFWANIEPEKNKYDIDYLKQVCEHIRYLESIGIDVIVDIHQDLYSKKYSGDGAPAWACLDGGKPFKQQTPWNLNYLQPATRAAIKNFWKSEDLQNRYIEMLKIVAKQVEDLDNVIGIDVMNEPFPNLPWIRRFEKKWLTNFYRKMATSLLVAGYKKIMFFEPWMCTSTGIPTYLDFKSESVKTGYMPHCYISLDENQKKYSGLQAWWMKQAIRIKAAEAQLFDTPLLFGEWGIPMTCEGYADYINDFTGLCDQYGASWVWWSYDMEQHCGFGLIDNDKNDRDYINRLARVYPQKIAGNNPKITRTDNFLYLEYTSTGVSGDTIVFAPDGYRYDVSTNVSYKKEDNTIVFQNTCNKVKITIMYRKQ